mmetsp:Transcript_21923/g.52010  ORF Transcript_21923/g.52010 Transcript_21923/m.52010 type:complete len:82 (-) Transcript_21923:42-287(-)
MLFWQCLEWTDIYAPDLDPLDWDLPPEEQRRALHERTLKLVQAVHDQAAWQRRVTLGWFQAMGELFCCMTTPSVDLDEVLL